MEKEEKYPLDNYDWDLRKLTPTECFRLMDVDEEDIQKMVNVTYVTKNGVTKRVLSDSALYKCAGNSIVVGVMERCFENLFYPKDELPTGHQLNLF